MDINALRKRLGNLGLFLPITFNFHDQKRLTETQNDKDLLIAYKDIQNSISSVQKANLSINHSNYSL